MDPTTKLIESNRQRTAETAAKTKHEEAVQKHADVSETIKLTTQAFVDWLSGHTSQVEITNHLESIGTPDALKIIPELKRLQRTLQTHKNTDLTEITKVMRMVLLEAKNIPKEHPEFPESHKPIDNTEQLESMATAIETLRQAIEDKNLEVKVEAPNVTVPAPNVHVDAPDLAAMQPWFEKIVKAVGNIVIPEYKTDNTKVEKMLAKINTALKEIARAPGGGGGGGGGGRVSPYELADGTPMMVTLNDDGTLPIQQDPLVQYVIADIDDANTVEYFGYLKMDGSWYIRQFDKGASPKTVRFAFGASDYPDAFTGRAGLTYGYLNQ